MRDIILIVPANCSISSLRERLPVSVSSLMDEQGSRLTVSMPDFADLIELVIDKSVAEFYEDDELEAISILGDDPNFILVHFKNIEGLKNLLASIANTRDVLIDNDFGLIEDGVSFNKRCQSQSGWDWAR